MPKIVVFDIGGTNFRAAVYDTQTGELLEEEKESTPTHAKYKDFKAMDATQQQKIVQELQQELLGKITSKINKFHAKYPDISEASIAFPGPVTSEGVVQKCSSLWCSWETQEGFDLQGLLNERLQKQKIRCFVINDMTAAAFRYVGKLQKEQFTNIMSIITVSTGIGNKVVDMRKAPVVLLDKKGIGGEIGHAVYDTALNAMQCDCGGKGHLTDIASGAGVQKLITIIQKLINNPNPKVRTAIAEYEKYYQTSRLAHVRGKITREDIESEVKAADKFTRGLIDPYKKYWALAALFNQSCLKNNSPITNKDFVAAVKAGDKFANYVLDYTTLYMAQAINNTITNVGSTKFIIIGGFANALGKSYTDSLQGNLNAIGTFGLKPEQRDNLLELGINDDRDGLVGAGIYAYQQRLTDSSVLTDASSTTPMHIRSRL